MMLTVKLRRWLAEYVDDGNCQARIAAVAMSPIAALS